MIEEIVREFGKIGSGACACPGLLAVAKSLSPETVLCIGSDSNACASAVASAMPGAECYFSEFSALPADLFVPGADDRIANPSFYRCGRGIESCSFEEIGGFLDLVYIPNTPEGDAVFSRLEWVSGKAAYICVTGYQSSREGFLAVNEWLWLNKAIVESAHLLPGAMDAMLIKSTCSARGSQFLAAENSALLATQYTSQYYLTDCGGYDDWQSSAGKSLHDGRLQTVADVALSFGVPATVVDLGAGRGELSYFFARRGSRVTAIDYSSDAAGLIEKTFEGDTEARTRVEIVCDSVLNPRAYCESYDLAVASDLVEHLSPEEDDALYAHMSRLLTLRQGVFVIHTAPNLWCYRYEHPRRQRMAKQAGSWLPKTRRTWYERLMHINEQAPNVLRKQLARHFPHVIVWFAKSGELGGSLASPYGVSDMRKATSLFAVASHKSLEKKQMAQSFYLAPIPAEEAAKITVEVSGVPAKLGLGERFAVRATLRNGSGVGLHSHGPQPFNLSYHWEDDEGRPIVYDGMRTGLVPRLAPGSVGEYSVRVCAPSEPGRYFLRVVPVQEMVRWMEQANSTALPVRVGSDGIETSAFGNIKALTTADHGGKIFFGDQSRPVMLIVETVNTCNNDCVICAYGRQSRKKQSMDKRVFEKVVTQYSEMGGGALSLTPVVGDVLLDKHLMDRIHVLMRFRDIVRPLSVTTNLVAADRFDDAQLSTLINFFDRVHVSVYGLDADEYAEMTGKDNYGKLLDALDRLRRLGLVEQITVGFRFLSDHSEEACASWIERYLGAPVAFGKTTSYANWSVLDTSVRLPRDACWLPIPQKKEPCLIPLVAGQVLSDGSVSFCPCDDFDGDSSLKLGDIGDSDLLALYNGHRATQLWKFNPVPGFCVNCSFYKPISDLPNYLYMFEKPLDFIGG